MPARKAHPNSIKVNLDNYPPEVRQRYEANRKAALGDYGSLEEWARWGFTSDPEAEGFTSNEQGSSNEQD